VRNQASAGRASFASGLFRFRGSVPALRVGGTRGAVEIELRNQAVKSSCEIKLRLDRFSHASGLFRFRGSVPALRVGGTRGAVKIELRNQASA